MKKLVDLRRDTNTLPTGGDERGSLPLSFGGMRVYGEDPRQRELEELAAFILGKERAIFLPSGTMGNLVALLTHTQRGNEIILEENAHIFTSETGGLAQVAD